MSGKLSLYILVLKGFLFTTLMATESKAQFKNVHEVNININLENSSVEETLKHIEKSSDYNFHYYPGDLDKNVRMTLRSKKISVGDVLLKISKKARLKFKQINNDIAVAKVTKPSAERIIVKLEEVKVTGKVTDDTGEGLPGVSVIVKGTTTGVATDIDGNYAIEVPVGSILEFTAIGYETYTTEIGGRSVIDVELKADISALDELVVVGYGVQKKVNVTGATATVQSKELSVRPVRDVPMALQGRVAGLNIVQNSGQPGDEGISIRLRGIGSFGNSAPYILIDGVPGDMTSVNPADVQSISVLKDAAASAIYGALGANGVILITTISGERNTKPTIQLSTSFGFQEATVQPDYIYNSVEHMELWNRGAEHTGVGPRYSQEMIDAYKNAAPGDPRYPNFNWIDHMFQSGSINNHQLSVRGSGKSSSYYVNFGIIEQEGIIDRFEATKYSTRVNLDFDVNDYLSVGSKSFLAYRDIKEPTADNIFEMMLYIYTMPPTMTPRLSDGSGRYTARDIPGIWRNRNPEMVLNNRGATLRGNYNIDHQFFMDLKPIDGLSWKTTGAVRAGRIEYNHTYEHLQGYTFSSNQNFGQFEPILAGSGVTASNSRYTQITVNSVANYNFSINQSHNIGVLAGYEQQEENLKSLWVQRPELPTITATDIDAGSTEGQSAGEIL